MAGKPVLFDEEAAQRIADVVRDYSPPVQNVAGKRGPARRPYNPQTFVKITGSTLTSGTYYHTWTEQQRTATSWEDKPSGLTSTAAATAVMPDKSMVSTNSVVAVQVDYLDDDTIVATIIGATGVQLPILSPVKITGTFTCGGLYTGTLANTGGNVSSSATSLTAPGTGASIAIRNPYEVGVTTHAMPNGYYYAQLTNDKYNTTVPIYDLLAFADSGTAKYQVSQMLTSTQRGWDYVRAHA